MLKSGGDFTTEYVERLKDGVETHLPGADWCCLSDVPEVATEALTDDLPGWWSKLELFRPGLFSGRVLYFDLDTVITGDLSEIASYSGPFAALEDFYTPSSIGSGVMAWEAGHADHLYTKWRGQKPNGGDQTWIMRQMGHIDRLQNLYPGQIASYKAHVRAQRRKARVVCFHGRPRPHEVKWRV